MMPEGEALTIIAGGGPIPSYVAAAATKAGRPVFVIGIKGEADRAIVAFPHEFLDWGQLGRLDEILRSRQGRDLVLVGSIRSRPDFKGISLDLATMRSIKDILAIIIGGDDDVLTGAIRFFEEDELPELSLGRVTPQEIHMLFEHHRNPDLPTEFD